MADKINQYDGQFFYTMDEQGKPVVVSKKHPLPMIQLNDVDEEREITWTEIQDKPPIVIAMGGTPETARASIHAFEDRGVHIYLLNTVPDFGEEPPLNARPNDIIIDASGGIWSVDNTLHIQLVRPAHIQVQDISNASTIGKGLLVVPNSTTARNLIGAAALSHTHVVNANDVVGLSDALAVKLTANKVTNPGVSTATTFEQLLTDYNDLLARLVASGVMIT